MNVAAPVSRVDRPDPTTIRPDVPTIATRAPERLPWTKLDTLSFLCIAVIAAATRFIGVSMTSDKGTPVFDEKHYVPQAWEIVQSSIDPITGGIEANPGFGLTVHPPLAKQLLAIGEMFFGYTPLGWRFMTALFSTAVILGIMAIARRLSASSVVALFAGIIACCDGVLLVGGRFGMLDIFLVGFVVAAAYFLIRDHQQMRQRLYDAYYTGQMYQSEFGPRLGFRWWRFAAGVALGLALGVKWSGLYYMAFFGILAVCLDYSLRRQYRVKRPLLGTLLFDAFPAFASIVILPTAIYMWTWRAWFASETSIHRHAAEAGTIPENSALRLLPDSLASWLYYQSNVLKFHGSLTTSSGHSHPWDSKPWSWLAATRPVMYYSANNVSCDGTNECRRLIYLFGTPAIWWLTVPIVLWALWCVVVKRDQRFLVPLVAFAAGFLPWLFTYDRQMYFFYAEPLVPFTIVMIALTLSMMVGRGKATPKLGPVPAMTTGSWIVVGYLAVVVAMFIYFSPILYGLTMNNDTYESIMWLRSWK